MPRGAVLFAAGGWLAVCALACTERNSTDGVVHADNPCSPLADPAVEISHEGVTEDGHYAVFLGNPGASPRVFYGTREHMVEGRVSGTSVGCAESFDFAVEGRSYGAVFASPSCPPDVTSRLVAGEIGGPMVTQTLEVLIGAPQAEAGAAVPPPSAFAFFCF